MMRSLRSEDPRPAREVNLSTVLFCLLEGGALSRATLAKLTGLNKTTISSLVEQLLAQGWVHEIGRDTAKTGRPATLLTLNPQAGCAIGVELGVDYISIIQTNFVGEITWQRFLDVEGPEQQQILQQTVDLVKMAMRSVEGPGQRLLGIGVTVPGLVNITDGSLLFSPNLQWRDVPLQKIFCKQIKLPVIVENDANAGAIGERLFGQARQLNNFLYVSIGVGVGSGLYLNGEMYRGFGGVAGEIGHTNFTQGNRPCRCGHRGCWEAYTNQYALIERVRALLATGRSSIITQMITPENPRLTLAMIAQAAQANDNVTLEALAETGEAIGVGIANLINIFNPGMVIIGGAMSVVGDYLLPTISEVVKQYALSAYQQSVRVTFSTFGPMSVVMGAAALVVNATLFQPNRVLD